MCYQNTKDELYVGAYVAIKMYEYLTKEEVVRVIGTHTGGEAGRGKSFGLNRLVAVLRRMVGSRKSVTVGGATGVAAFNAGGQTLIRELGVVKVNRRMINMGECGREVAGNGAKEAIFVVLDKIAVVANYVTTEAATVAPIREHWRQEGGFGGGDKIPLVILLGDVLQLPSVSRGAIKSQD